MLLLFFWFLGGRAVDRFAEAAPRFAATLAEATIRAGILFHNRFFLHIISIAVEFNAVKEWMRGES